MFIIHRKIKLQKEIDIKQKLPKSISSPSLGKLVGKSPTFPHIVFCIPSQILSKPYCGFDLAAYKIKLVIRNEKGLIKNTLA